MLNIDKVLLNNFPVENDIFKEAFQNYTEALMENDDESLFMAYFSDVINSDVGWMLLIIDNVYPSLTDKASNELGSDVYSVKKIPTFVAETLNKTFENSRFSRKGRVSTVKLPKGIKASELEIFCSLYDLKSEAFSDAQEVLNISLKV